MKIDSYINKYKKPLSLIGAVGIMISVWGVFAMEHANADFYKEGDGGGGGGNGPPPSGEFNDTRSGTLTEGNSETFGLDPGGLITGGTFTLTWQDESDEVGRQNDGDTFNLTVTAPDGQYQTDTVKNQHNQEGEIILTFDGEGLAWEGSWEVSITLEEAGEQWLIFPPVVGTTDDSNSWNFDAVMNYA